MILRVLSFIRNLIVYLLLKVIYPRGIRSELPRDGNKSRNRKHRQSAALDVEPELEEDFDLPENWSAENVFVSFSRDGCLSYWKTLKDSSGRELLQLFLDVPGQGTLSYTNMSSHTSAQVTFRLKLLEPMRRWKLEFNGPMTSQETGLQIHVKMSMFWQCVNDPFDHWRSRTAWQQAKCISFQDLFRSTCTRTLTRYDQLGEMRGRVEIFGHEKKETIRLRLKSNRSRCFTENALVNSELVKELVVCVERHGQMFTSVVSKDIFSSRTVTGHVTHPCGEVLSADFPDSLQGVVGKDQLPSVIEVSVGRECYKIERHLSKARKEVSVGTNNEDNLVFSTYTVNGQPAYGIEVQFKSSDITMLPPKPAKRRIPVQLTGDMNSLIIVGLDKDTCEINKLTGGKGSNLAFLKRHGFCVPTGFCVSASVLDTHIDITTSLADAVSKIPTALNECDISTALKTACTTAVGVCLRSKMSQEIEKEVEAGLIKTFGENFANVKVAVRSSGVSEDGEFASSAGQMMTLLNVKGLVEICRAIIECWASSLTYQVVEYRRQNGQRLLDSMAVVIQKMVEADVAGVLFTDDPVSGDSSLMVIEAFPGLGEAVVSGSVTPDTIKVRRGENIEDINIESYLVRGRDGGVLAADEYRDGACMSTEKVHELCKICVEVESLMECPQDIEWAMAKGKFFILQARPITTTSLDEVEDFVNEFDTPLMSDTAVIMSHNVGEVIPGATTPLTLDTVLRAVDCGLKNMVEGSSYSELPHCSDITVAVKANHCFLNMTSLCLSCDAIPLMRKVDMDMFLAGGFLPENKIEDVRQFEGRRKTFFELMKGTFRHYLVRFRKEPKRFQEWADQISSFAIGENTTEAKELYARIDDNLESLNTVWKLNLYKTAESSTFSAVIMGMFRGDKLNLSADDNSDIAWLLSNCSNVESADVPSSLHKLASAVRDSDTCQAFLNSADEKMVSILAKSKDEKVQKMFSDFLDKHGHRCYKEAELFVKSWAMDPKPLCKILKQVIETDTQLPNRHLSVEEALKKVKKPLSFLQRELLRRYLIPKARKGVADRERGKSVSIKTGDIFKCAYWRLARMLVREGRLPDADLLFFMTHRDIGDLLDSRSVQLIRIAKRRKSVFSIQEAIEFPRVNIGIPKPLQVEEETDTRHIMSVQGTVVCSGVVEGRAFVIKSLEEADALQKGDILICPFTDVGWTPLFSMISGVVTEIGGVVSHGSVVAREVGIPCIVNVPAATRIFKTGDRIRIDGLSGVVHKLDGN